MNGWHDWCEDYVPGYQRLLRLPGQLLCVCPFRGDLLPGRVPLLAGSRRPTAPYPTPWNYDRPIEILETFFWDADQLEGSGRHNRFLDFPGAAPVLVTRDPSVIRAITAETGDRQGQFDRDTLPSTGIARATGPDTLLYANGSRWRRQRKLAASPFGKTTLFQPERFREFAETFRETVSQRLQVLREHVRDQGDQGSTTVVLEPEIKTVMLEMLTNNFFGADIPYVELRERFVPAIERVIDHIVRDTVVNRLRIPVTRWPSWTRRIAQAKADFAVFEELTTLVLEPRHESRGLWGQFKSEAPDAQLRSNLKVFLAGALEATTSFASWALSHLARHPDAQAKLFDEVRHIDDYTPGILEESHYLSYILNETLRLTPSLYFLPRRATRFTWVETSTGARMGIPKGTHILLDVWHANRHADHWGESVTGFPADQFVPERWPEIAARGIKSKDALHFGFGHGPRVCPGKHLGELETALVVGAMVKLFKLEAIDSANPAKAGVSTKPADGATVQLRLRELEPA